jgi:hypothetical protein
MWMYFVNEWSDTVIVLVRRSLDGFWKWPLKGGDKGVIVSREALLEIGFTFNKRGSNWCFKRHRTALKLAFHIFKLLESFF